ncbi:MAG: hypothetical protein K5871_03530 [Lachnospiraceae bacterium]|nr:hypothetical protein [Lachnospiraceae bacterium]
MENIYADYGNIINTSRYINREEAEAQVRARLLDNDAFGSMGLVGTQRIGKSSLAENVFKKNRKELLKDKVMVLDLVMYNYNTPDSFFRAIADQAFEILEDLDEVTSKLERRYNRIADSSVEETGGERIRSFFKQVVSEMGYRVICIIDEFDYSKKLFKDYPEGFFVLRELAYQPENKIGFLFLSRHLMAELEAGVGFDVSNFSNILLNAYLSEYTDGELDKYFANLASAGVEVTDEIRNQYLDITGRIPFWMDILSFHYINSLENGDDESLYEIFEDHQEVFYGEFQKFFALLEDQDLLKALYQVVLGPMGDDATPRQITRLKNYGLIDGDEETGFRTISKYFRRFMVMKEQTVDFYPLWNRTEKLLRMTGAAGLKKKYGDDWEADLENVHVKPDDSANGHGNYKTIGDHILGAKRQIDDMKRKTAVYEIDASEINLLNGTTTGGLASILKAEYNDCFRDVFRMPLGEFSPLIDKLTAARNPYDHNNDNLIRDDVKQETNENCSKLVKLMEAYLDLS